MQTTKKETLEILRGDLILADLGNECTCIPSGIRPCVVIQNNMGNKYSNTGDTGIHA